MTATRPIPPTPRTPQTPPRLAARGLSLSYGGGTDVVRDLDLDVLDGSVTAVVGPNGCGKSTLLRALGRLLRPRSGAVTLDGRSIHGVRTAEVARQLGLLPQAPVAPEGLTVAELVARGRYPHQSWLRQWSRDDERAVADALEWTGTADLADRALDELSGGQRQRAWLATALAQQTGILLLDEPTTYLDIAHAVEVLDLVDRLHDERGCTVVMVLHDLTLAARYADRLVVMDRGRIAAVGDPGEVLTAELVRDVFGVPASIVPDPVSGRPLVIPIGTRHVHPHLVPGAIPTPSAAAAAPLATAG
jgi:iron complex transport system ATP-binding protein